MPAHLSKRWYDAAAPHSLLEPLSWLYGAVVGARRRAYEAGWLRSERVACPVIVIGNLTVGGTGKTPLTLWLAAQLRARGYAVGILSRGYGRAGRGVAVVQPDSAWQEVGDEPVLLARRSGCPTVVAAQRVAGARRLFELGVRLILCDDGLQHLALERDCEIVVVDGSRGFGNGRLLPAGPLREPAPRLRQADLRVVNGCPDHASLSGAGRLLQMDLQPGAAQPLLPGQPGRALEAFRGEPVHAVAGIGNPARFFAELRAKGLNLIEHAFPDHHPMRAQDVSFGDARPVLMTEKDAVKCAPFATAQLWYVPVDAHFADAEAHEILSCIWRKSGDPLVPGG